MHLMNSEIFKLVKYLMKILSEINDTKYIFTILGVRNLQRK